MKWPCFTTNTGSRGNFCTYLPMGNVYLQQRNKKSNSFKGPLCSISQLTRRPSTTSCPSDSESKQNWPALGFTLVVNILWWIWPLVTYVVRNWIPISKVTSQCLRLSCQTP